MTARWNDETVCELFSMDDRLVWTQVVRTVVPIDEHQASCSPHPLWRRATWEEVTPNIIQGRLHSLAQASEIVAWRQGEQIWLSHGDDAHIDYRTASRLRRGRLRIKGRLDLHGLSQAHAHAALRRFVSAAWQLGLRSILVITGKGNRTDGGVGVLRSAVPLWLNEPDLRPKVLSFTYARPRDGGEGALYLLIRRRRVDSAI